MCIRRTFVLLTTDFGYNVYYVPFNFGYIGENRLGILGTFFFGGGGGYVGIPLHPRPTLTLALAELFNSPALFVLENYLRGGVKWQQIRRQQRYLWHGLSAKYPVLRYVKCSVFLENTDRNPRM